MRYKVVKESTNASVAVVREDYGTLREDANGREFVYLPIPVCRCPTGYTVTDEQALSNATVICQLLNQQEELFERARADVAKLSIGAESF